MYLSSDIKKKVFADYSNSENDTGSPEGQIALFTHRIQHLTKHLRKNKKDLSTRRSLLQLVGKRRRQLDYLKENDIERYRAIIKKLGIRK